MKTTQLALFVQGRGHRQSNLQRGVLYDEACVRLPVFIALMRPLEFKQSRSPQ